MSCVCSGGFDDRVRRRSRLALRLANRLCLAAAPTFAAMSLIAVVTADGSALCLTTATPALNGMAAMYLLMSAFHLPPWLKLMISQSASSKEGSEP